VLRQNHPHPRLERIERRLPRRPLILRRPSDATARSTVDRPILSSLAACRLGTPFATSYRTDAQSSTEITHPIYLGGSSSPVAMASSSTAAVSTVSTTTPDPKAHGIPNVTQRSARELNIARF
jgi:hypothetical protein